MWAGGVSYCWSLQDWLVGANSPAMKPEPPGCLLARNNTGQGERDYPPVRRTLVMFLGRLQSSVSLLVKCGIEFQETDPVHDALALADLYPAFTPPKTPLLLAFGPLPVGC